MGFDEARATPTAGEGESELAISWFPAGEYEAAIERWADLGEIWSDVPHGEYSRRMDGQIKWFRAHGVAVGAVAPIVVDEYVAWCAENDVDEQEARAVYATERLSQGRVTWWPPERNDPCWCGSGRKYKRCCGPAPARPMHAEADEEGSDS